MTPKAVKKINEMETGEVRTVEVKGRTFAILTGQAPLKPEEIGEFTGTLSGYSKGRYGPILHFADGTRIFAVTKIVQILGDNLDQYIGRDLYIKYLGKVENPSTHRRFHDFDIGIAT